MLEIDGVKMFQGAAMLNYVGAKYNLKPTDPMVNYRGEKAVEHTMGDFFGKHMYKLMFASDEERDALVDVFVAADGPFHQFLNSLSSKCLGDSKFLCGDEVTIHDFVVAGFFVNVPLNPNNVKVGPKMMASYEANAPDRLKQYITDFRTAMQAYLA